MSPNSPLQQQWKNLWPGRKVAIRRLLLIALALFPLTWIAEALLVGNWDIREDRNGEAFRHLTQAAVIFIASTCIVFLVSLLPFLRRFSEWLFSGRIVRRAFIVLAWALTCIVLFYGVEDWRGRRGWNNYSAALKAQGDELDYKAFVPKPIPDTNNFAATPEIQSWFAPITNDNGSTTFSNRWQADDFARAQGMLAAPEILPYHITDLVAWQTAFNAVAAGHTSASRRFKSDKLDPELRERAALAILEALKPIEPRLEELRAAAQRPDAVYPVVYRMDDPWAILLPHLGNIRAVCQRLDLRACAELAAGHSDQALEDVKLMLRIANSLKSDPFLISYLVRVAAFQIAIHPVWEGLAEQRWSDAQLRELQTSLGDCDLIADMKRAFDAERAAGILTVDLLAGGKFRLNNLTGDPSNLGSKTVNVFGQIVPHGWYQMEKLNYCRLYDLQLKGAFDAHQTRMFPDRLESDSNALDQAFGGRNPISTICTRHQLLAVIMLPALQKVPMRGAIGQVTADQAALACALERCRLAHGQFPERLDALMPDFISMLPHDVLSGDAYKYQRTDDRPSPFVLYSVGWNGTDDGGQEILKGNSVNLSQGDWVWKYSTQ